MALKYFRATFPNLRQSSPVVLAHCRAGGLTVGQHYYDGGGASPSMAGLAGEVGRIIRPPQPSLDMKGAFTDTSSIIHPARPLMNHTSFATSLGLSQAEAALHAYDSRTRDGLKSIQKVRYSHEAMADLIISNPSITHTKIAEVFGRSGSWISIVINSDAFKAFLAKRKGDVVDPLLLATTRERFEAVVNKSAEVLLEKLNQPIEKIADNTALRAMEIGAKALGVGGNAPPPLAGDHLASLAERLIALNSRSRSEGVIHDIEAHEIRSHAEAGSGGGESLPRIGNGAEASDVGEYGAAEASAGYGEGEVHPQSGAEVAGASS